MRLGPAIRNLNSGRGRRWAARLALPALLALGVSGLAPPAIAAGSSQPFIVATSAEPDSIDITRGIFPPVNYVSLRNIYEALWGYANDGKVKQTVATWTVSPDHKVITFHLKHGIHFQSGDELTASDVVFGYDRLVKLTHPFMRHAKFIQSVKALNKYTVQIVFKRPDVTFFNGVSLFPADKAYHDRVGEKYFQDHPDGIGPYKFVQYKRGQYMDMEAWPGYYGKQPQIKHVRFMFVKDNQTRVAMLEAGDADMIMDAPFTEVAKLKSEGFNVVKLPANPTVSIEFDMLNTKAPWHDIRVREAIAHAVDAGAIIKGLFEGVPDRYPRLAPGEAGFDPTLKNYTYNPKLAKKLLAEAGYPHGFTMPLYYTGGFFYGFRQTTEAVVLYLKQVGIICDVHELEGPKGFSFVANVAKHPNIPYVSISGMPIANSGLPSLEALYLSFYPSSPFVLYHYPEIINGINQAQSELDPVKRADDIKRMNKFLYDQYASITLWDGMSVFAMKKNVHYQPIEHRMPFLVMENVHVTK
ncbi:MAG: ABC transporter substrate-binding protein [Stellaceae bacterium]